MNLKIKLRAFGARGVLKSIVSLSLLLHSLPPPAMGQAKRSNESGEIYAGIEITTERAMAIAVRVSGGEEEPSLKLVYSETIRLALGRAGNGQFAPQAIQEAAQAVSKLLTRLKQQYRTPPERIFLIGSSSLGADCPEGLVNAIGRTTGKTLAFLDVETEVQLSIAGTVSRLGKVGDTQIDNRNSSALIEINSNSINGGYQLLKYLSTASPRYDFVTMSLPYGALSLANEISRTARARGDLSNFTQRVKTPGAASLRQALRREREGKPGLVNRKRVYLTGDIAWAAATLLYPEDQQMFVPMKYEEIMRFAEKVARARGEILNPNLLSIRDRRARRRAELALQAVKSALSSQQLIAGAETLKAVASEFEWQEKQIWFARFGQLGCLLSYVRLQAEK